jgi:hypothetical protein
LWEGDRVLIKGHSGKWEIIKKHEFCVKHDNGIDEFPLSDAAIYDITRLGSKYEKDAKDV